MSKRKEAPAIQLRGVRHNNLKNFDLDLPIGKWTVITGLSGSGKSSLAFDTIYAEGQRRYIETFSPYARQFFDRMDKPQVDSIQGIPPAIAIEQRNSVRTTRSTVGTMTEICDCMKAVWPHLSQLYCRQCGQRVAKDSPQEIWKRLSSAPEKTDWLITFDLPLSEKIPLEDSLALVAKQGYQRLLLEQAGDSGAPHLVRIDEAAAAFGSSRPASLTVAQDRISSAPAQRARFIEACEQAYHFGKGRLAARSADGATALQFSNRLHCAECNLDYKEASSSLFSFNHPAGACPTCRGFGRTIAIDYQLAIPDWSLSLAQGAVKPWQTGLSAECQEDLLKYCKIRGAPKDVPFRDLPKKWQDWVIEGDPGYGSDEAHSWPKAWYGVKGYFRSLEARTYKMHVRVLLSRYRSYQTCPVCQGERFQPESLCHKVELSDGRRLTLSDFYRLPVDQALPCLQTLAAGKIRQHKTDPMALALEEVSSRLEYLRKVGLGYLTLDRPTRTLSGGETERVSLTTCLGSRLVNTLFILDEPSVGLHPHDTDSLIRILQQLRDAGNTVVVVEHEASVMAAADRIVDMGPGHGASGGSVVFEGTYEELKKSDASLTGKYLSGRLRIETPSRRPVTAETPRLRLTGAARHNLKNLSASFPLGRLLCVTGVSGSGKSTLVREVLMPALRSKLEDAEHDSSERDESEEEQEETLVARAGLSGTERIGRVIMVDQTSIGRTPRSNPAVYAGAFDDIREIFAATEQARQQGLSASAFSFNSKQGQCECCRGSGFEKIEMQFLSDIYIRCPDCNGRRYRSFIQEIKISPDAAPAKPEKASARKSASRAASPDASAALSIADVLEATVDEAVLFLSGFDNSRPAARAVECLRLLQDVGLGYLGLGQPVNTLSGGESQRLKLAGHLVEFARNRAKDTRPALFLFDEPTTGLHFEDVRVLLQVFQRLVDAGHSVIVIEHNMDVVKCADWVIDIGPGAGDSGGQIVAEGTPETVAACAGSLTGAALKKMLR